jgi:hypothetical protein
MTLPWAIALALIWGAVNAVAGWALCCLMTQAKLREEAWDNRRTTHFWSGPCRCLHCGHEWIGVLEVTGAQIGPLDGLGLECPHCRYYTGEAQEAESNDH